MANKKSFTITRFKNQQNKERNVFDKIVINNNIPTEQEVASKGFVQYIKRVGGQVHQMYSLVDYEYKLRPQQPITENYLRIEQSDELVLTPDNLLIPIFE